MSQSTPPGSGPDVPGFPPAEPEGRRRSPLVAVVAVLLVVALVATAGLVGWQLLDDDESAAGDRPAPTGSPATLPSGATGLDRFYGQEIQWKKCGRVQCGLLTVPLDYEAPDGDTLRLAVLKVPATEKDSRIGSLVVNPGGPGGSGVNYAAAGSLQFGVPLSRVYDIVGFDPRGVAQSEPLQCLSTEELDEVVAFDPDPDTPAEVREMDELIRGFGQGCLDESGDLARHMSTREVVRDLDILRAALGEDKLDYLGASYGTLIGATYADMFPDRVGRFVLDGAIDPSLSNEELSLQQAGGFETALRAYVTQCVESGDCFLGDTVEAGLTTIRQFLAEVEKEPLPTGEERELTEGLAMLGIWMPLYVKEYWGQLTTGLQQAIEERDGSVLLGLADTYTSRGPDGFSDNSMEALYAVNCLDHGDYTEPADVPKAIDRFTKVSPTFGRAFAHGLSTCASWPVKSDERTTALKAAGAPPIVVVGTTRDPATPVQWAEAMASQLESGRLVVRDGDGHTGFQRGNQCVDDAVETWLIEGKAPRDGLRC